MVEVDSGTLLVGDPRPGVDCDAAMRTSDPPVTHLDGRPVLLLSRLGGDGTYPVFGEIDEDGGFLRATMEFVVPDDD